jgi:hypothetical protein
MQIPELTPFLQLGQEKAVWRLSWRNAIGTVLGLLLGGQLARVFAVQGVVLLVLVAVCMVIGLWLSAERNRIWRVLRFWLWVRLWARQLTATPLDPQDWYLEPPPPVPLVPARTWDGEPLLEVRSLEERQNGWGTHA